LATGRVERRLAAILAADVAGYSRLMGADEEGTHERLKTHLRELVDPKINKHRGRIVKNTGDGMLVEFPSVVDAVRCAVEIQRSMADRNADTTEDKRIIFRVGVNLGDVIVGDDDIYGDGVNIAARLEALAEPGGICLQRRFACGDHQRPRATGSASVWISAVRGLRSFTRARPDGKVAPKNEPARAGGSARLGGNVFDEVKRGSAWRSICRTPSSPPSSNCWTGTRLEDGLADLLWSFVNLFHRKVDRIERELDHTEQAQRRGQAEQDGSEVKSVELERLIGQGLIVFLGLARSRSGAEGVTRRDYGAASRHSRAIVRGAA
jgi:class 3 adenylate cyclase